MALGALPARRPLAENDHHGTRHEQLPAKTVRHPPFRNRSPRRLGTGRPQQVATPIGPTSAREACLPGRPAQFPLVGHAYLPLVALGALPARRPLAENQSRRFRGSGVGAADSGGRSDGAAGRGSRQGRSDGTKATGRERRDGSSAGAATRDGRSAGAATRGGRSDGMGGRGRDSPGPGLR